MNEVKEKIQKKFWFWLSISINLGFLGVFKYYNFFASSFADFISNLGFQVNVWTLKVLLPVGISFYTFHGLSYVIDIYYGRIKPEKIFIDYSVFVCFFPLLVAGPIERATHLLPQIKKKRHFDYSKASDALRQILWGLFKKVVIADNCAEYANLIFDNSSNSSGSTLVLGTIFFAFQIYCDFSGYSDIALGTARLLGIELLRNFSFPYFSRSIPEFWRRWHISLSSWFKDYLYIPLGGSRGSKWQGLRNMLIVFLVSGFWHGANWTFIAWGALNGLYFIPSILLNKHQKKTEIILQNGWLSSLKEIFQIVNTFLLISFAWIFFRSNNIEHAFAIISRIFSSSLFSIPKIENLKVFVFILLLLIVEWIQRNKSHGLQIETIKHPIIRRGFYLILFYIIFYFGGKQQDFIYFQF